MYNNYYHSTKDSTTSSFSSSINRSNNFPSSSASSSAAASAAASLVVGGSSLHKSSAARPSSDSNYFSSKSSPSRPQKNSRSQQQQQSDVILTSHKHANRPASASSNISLLVSGQSNSIPSSSSSSAVRPSTHSSLSSFSNVNGHVLESRIRTLAASSTADQILNSPTRGSANAPYNFSHQQFGSNTAIGNSSSATANKTSLDYSSLQPYFSPSKLSSNPNSIVSRELQIQTIQHEWESSGKKTSTTAFFELELLEEKLGDPWIPSKTRGVKSSFSHSIVNVSGSSINGLLNSLPNQNNEINSIHSSNSTAAGPFGSPPLNHLLIYGNAALFQLFPTDSTQLSPLLIQLLKQITHISLLYIPWQSNFFVHIQPNNSSNSSSSSSSASIPSNNTNNNYSFKYPLSLHFLSQFALYCPNFRHLTLQHNEIHHFVHLKPLLLLQKYRMKSSNNNNNNQENNNSTDSADELNYNEYLLDSIRIYNNPVAKHNELLKSYIIGLLNIPNISWNINNGPGDYLNSSNSLMNSIGQTRENIQNQQRFPPLLINNNTDNKNNNSNNNNNNNELIVLKQNISNEIHRFRTQWREFRQLELNLIANNQINAPNIQQRRMARRITEKLIESAKISIEKSNEFDHEWNELWENQIQIQWNKLLLKNQSNNNNNNNNKELLNSNSSSTAAAANNDKESHHIISTNSNKKLDRPKSAGVSMNRRSAVARAFQSSSSSPFSGLAEESLHAAAVETFRHRMSMMMNSQFSPLLPGSGGSVALQQANQAIFNQIHQNQQINTSNYYYNQFNFGSNSNSGNQINNKEKDKGNNNNNEKEMRAFR